MERLAAHVWRRLAGDADLEQDLALERALAHGVVAVVGAIECLVRADVDTVRVPEHALAPRTKKIAVAVEHHHRVFAAVEDVDLVLGIDGDGCGIAQRPAVRQLCPILQNFVAELAGSERDGHVPPPFLDRSLDCRGRVTTAQLRSRRCLEYSESRNHTRPSCLSHCIDMPIAPDGIPPARTTP